MVEIIYNGFDSLYESRIRAAEANGIIPDAGDIALVATERRKSYAIVQSSGVMNIDKLQSTLQVMVVFISVST